MDMGPPYQVRGILQTNENYVRLKTLMLYSEMDLYYKIFHEKAYGGFSTNPQELYEQLQRHNIEIQALFNQKLISKEDYHSIFPSSHETYSQEFSVDLFYALAKQCVKKFPTLMYGDSVNSSFAYLNEMEKLQGFGKDKRTQESVNSSSEEFHKCWNEIISILKNLGYDVNKVIELRDNYLDDNKKFRFAWIRAQVNLLSNMCTEFMKTAELNTFAINKLLMNFNAAISESKEDSLKQSDHGTASSSDGAFVKGDMKTLKTLKNQVYSTAEQLTTAMDEIERLKPLMKCWREKNIEGDVIVLDEILSRLKNEVNEQSWTVGEMFNSVSLDIVKIKERLSFHGNDASKFIVSPDQKRDRSGSRSERKRDSKATDV